MAIGDIATSAGLPLVPSSGAEGKVKYGAREINRTRDQVAAVMLETRPVAKGGTGATTAAAARTNLGVPTILSGTAAPSNANGNDGDVYIRYTA
jgi:hypothetical protein